MSDDINMSDDRRRNQANPKTHRKVSFQKNDHSSNTAAVPDKRQQRPIEANAEEEEEIIEVKHQVYVDRSHRLNNTLALLAAQNRASLTTNLSLTILPKVIKKNDNLSSK